MLRELRGYGLLLGSRGRPPADISVLAETVVHMSELAAALPAGVANVEINPLLVLPVGAGVLMLDAAVELVEGEYAC
jgi:acetate---CoA ligase (ADP-forming)